MLLLMIWVGLLCSHAHISSSWKVPLFIILLCFFFFFDDTFPFVAQWYWLDYHTTDHFLYVCVFNQILLLLKLFRLSPSSISHIGFFFIFALGLRSLCFHYFWLIFTFYSFAVVEKKWISEDWGALINTLQHFTHTYTFFCFSSLFVIPAARLIPFFPPFLPLFFFFFSLLLPQTSYFIFLINFRPFMQLIITLEKARECFVLSIALHQKICNS